MTDQYSIELKNISKAYSSPIGPETPVLNGIDLSVRKGEAIAVVGPSGSGKSTLLNIIGTLDNPTEGSLLINGLNPCEMNDEAKAKLRNTDIGFIFQLHHLLPQFTVLDNVLLPVLAQQSSADGEIQERAHTLLERTGIADCAAKRPGQLSGGERQRAAVVRALINRPSILLADEPTGSLDKQTSQELTDLLLQLNKEDGLTMIVVTHSESLAEKMDRSLSLDNGNLTSAQ